MSVNEDMAYDVVIGIETHIQLNTKTKMFCRCRADFWGSKPNSQVCPVCLGLPGALPVINKEALDKAIMVGLALGSTIAPECKFDRKNYFYPDLAKGYQISQYDQPINIGGKVELDGGDVGLIRAHLEEDVAKLTHGDTFSVVDFNKGGVPLLEIVSEPVIHSAAQAKAYVQALHQLVRYIGVNDGNLERGVMRADVNISLQEKGKWHYAEGAFTVIDGYVLSNRVEIKNLNSFRSIERAIEFETHRQQQILQQGQSVAQETRGWDDAKGVTTAQRSKEEAHDYRYFPEPDLPPLVINKEWVETIRRQLPELPLARRQRFQELYRLSDYDARLLTDDRAIADWFEAAVTAYVEQRSAGAIDKPGEFSKPVANWMLGEIARLQNEHQNRVADSQLTPAHLATVLNFVDQGTLSVANAKEVVADIYVSGESPDSIVKAKGLEQVSGSDDLEPIAHHIIESNPEAVEKIKAGKTATIQFLVGQVMKETRGKANPGVVRELIERLLS